MRKKTGDPARASPGRQRTELEDLQQKAAAGAAAGVAYLRRLLEQNEQEVRTAQLLRAQLDRMDGIEITESGQVTILEEPPCPPEVIKRLKSALNRHKPLGDAAAASYLRALTAIAEQTAALLGSQEAAGAIRVVLNKTTKELVE